MQTGERSGEGVLGLLAWVTLAGACTMIVELSAVRLVAPWFGTSAAVWTNVIGVILLALALGYLAGARLTGSKAPQRALALVFLLSALFTAWLPGLARPVCSLFMPQGLDLETAAPLFAWGSLAATGVLFLLPAACLGCVGPLAVELVARRAGARAGAAGGWVLCASTLGSLGGTFATTHVLLPELGAARTLVGTGAFLGVGAAWLFRAADRRRAPVVMLLLFVLVGAAVPASRDARPALRSGFRLLEAAESPYQSLRVVLDETAPRPMRLLQVDEGLDSYQSIWVPEPGLIGEVYYDFFALPAWWTPESERDGAPWRVCVLGLGAGTTFRVLMGASPPGTELDLTGIELDSEAVALGERWFELDRAAHRVLAGQDARAALRTLEPGFDLLVLDAYAHQVQIPLHLSSLEFLREARAALAPGGWLAINVGGFGFDDPVVAAVGRTLASAFEQRVLALRVPSSRNFVLYARNAAALPDPDAPGFVPPAVVTQVVAPLVLPGGWSWIEPGGELLTDDRNPLERLQRASLEAGRRPE